MGATSIEVSNPSASATYLRRTEGHPRDHTRATRGPDQTEGAKITYIRRFFLRADLGFCASLAEAAAPRSAGAPLPFSEAAARG